MVSIIIPVYNVEKYLRKCIESVCSQTYTNWECILIDDGSSDSSGLVCDEYASKDSRIKGYHTLNRGVGASRNIGIDKVSGEWLVFIDGDDYITPDYIQSLVTEGEKRNADLVITQYEIENEKTGTIINNNFEPGYFERESMGAYFLKQTHHFFYSACYKLYRTEIIQKNILRFATDIHLGEDFLFSTHYLSHINSVSFINGGKYCYIQHPGSLTHKKINLKETYSFYCQFLDIYYKGIQKKFSKEMDHFLGIEVSASLERTLVLLGEIPTKEEQIKFLKNLNYECYRKYKKCISFNEWILKQSLVFKFPRLYLKLRSHSYKKLCNS